MGYREALEAAGATVHAFEEFGSYQGDWWARVTHEGRTGFVGGAYGSCSGCDAFDAEFGYGDDPTQEQLADFGRGYLSRVLTTDEALTEAGRNAEWDLEADSMVAWVRAQSAEAAP